MKTQLNTIAFAAVLLILVAGFSTAMFAQSVSTLHFGGNVSNFIGNDTKFDNKNIYDFKLGFQIGFTKTFGSFLQLEPGIFLANKGAKFKIYNYPGYDYPHWSAETLCLHLNYLQIPINLKVNFGDENLRFAVGIGVYGSVGLEGLIKTDNSSLLDFGGQIFGSVQYGRFGVNVGWQPGFSRNMKYTILVKNGSKDNPKIYNNTFFFGLSYIINKNEY